MSAAKLYQYKDIEYTLKKSERKTTSIYVERDGSVSVLAPKPFDMQRVEATLEKKRSWIYRNLAEWEDLNRARVHREYVNGESFLYLGRHYRLNIVEEQNAPLLLKHGQFCLLKKEVRNASEHFKFYYKTKLRNWIDTRIQDHSARMGVEPKWYRVLELKNRWGSCTASGGINIHWKCAMLPLTVLDYVIVHELAHIKYADHTALFWRTVEKVMPGFEEHKNWLKFNGAGMSL